MLRAYTPILAVTASLLGGGEGNAQVLSDAGTVGTTDASVAVVDAAVDLREIDRRDGVALPANARSVRVNRSGEVLHTRAEGSSPRRGAAMRGALLPALEAALGPGCAARWVRVGVQAWICLDYAELTALEPTPATPTLLAANQLTPYEYGFARFPGVPTFRSLRDAVDDYRAEELEQGMSVAMDGFVLHEGVRYAHTPGNRFVPVGDLHWARVSPRAGIAYPPQGTIASVGFLQRDVSAFATAEEAARRRGTARRIAARTPVLLHEEATVRGRVLVRTEQGWIERTNVRIPDVPAAPAEAGPNEHWVDVDRERQIMVAMEGNRPVYAALVSTGRAANPTQPGVFRVWAKLFATDMSNADDPEREDFSDTRGLYSMQRVPWVMFFHNDQALHGAYWHDRFGNRRSHGCVNLPARDARWLFEWAPPALPPGWEAVLPTREDPGMLVRVR